MGSHDMQAELVAAQQEIALLRYRLEQRMSDSENTVRRSKEKLQEIERVHDEWLHSLDMIGQPAFLHDPDYRIIQANRAYAECAGMALTDLLGKPYFNVFPRTGNPLPCCVPDLEKAGVADQLREYEFELAEGRVFLSRARAVSDFGGRYLYSVHILEDITQSRLARDALHIRSQRLAVLNSLLRRSLEDRPLQEQLEGALDDLMSLPWLPLAPRGGIFLVEDDPQTLVLKAQRNLSSSLLAMCASVAFGRCLCGRAAADRRLLHASCVDHRHENRYEGMLPHGHYAVPLVSGTALLGVIILYVPDGHKGSREEEEFLESAANTLAGVIERNKADTALKTSESRLSTIAAHLARLRTAGEMAAELAHELKQPLTAIATNAQASLRDLRKDTLDPELIREAMDDIKSDALRAADVIKHLRDFVRKTEPAQRPADMNEIIRGICRLIEVEAHQAGIKLRLELDEDIPKVLADAVQIEQVVLNLARNGIEAMRDMPASRKELVVHTSRRAPDVIEVRVRDSGEGIPDERVSDIFEPFHSTRPDGLGMGLCISRSIVDAHGGNLKVKSRPGHGSTFSFSLRAALG